MNLLGMWNCMMSDHKTDIKFLNNQEKIKRLKKEREGLVLTVKNGSSCEIIEYRNSNCVFVKWEDGSITSHVWSNLKRGEASSKENKYQHRVGKVFQSFSGEKAVVTAYKDNKSVEVEWEDGTKGTFRWEALQKGHFKNNSKLYYSAGKIEKRFKGDRDVYLAWHGMITRVNLEACLERNKTYRKAKITEELLNYEKFYDVYTKLKGYGEKGYHLDKDLLSFHLGLESPTYSEETLALLPPEVNKAIAYNRESSKLPVGVEYNKTKSNPYAARISFRGNRKHLGVFKDPDSAFSAYKEEKELQLKFLAEEYKDKIEERVYVALKEHIVQPYYIY